MRTSLGDAVVNRAQDALRLDIIADAHGPLIENLLAERTPVGASTWATTRDLARWQESEWVTRFTGTPTLVPSGLTADDYAKQIRQRLSSAYPTVLVTKELARADSSYQTLADFAFDHADYEMNVMSIRKLAHEHPEYFDPGTKAALIAKAEPIERLFRIAGDTDRYARIKALRTAGYDSALQVVRKGRAAFVAQLGGLTPAVSETAANEIFSRAVHVHSIATVVVTKYAGAFNPTTTGVLKPPTVPGGVAPDWASLFGAVDYCGCEECQSVLSPAAYMVDLLQFLRDRPETGPTSAFSKLDARRPDLGELPLTCANTNTVLPHIDLVNELLERRVQPTSPPVLDTTWTANELAVHPEHVHAGAYETLAGAAFPLGLPYDLWLDEARSYLNVLGTSRAGLRVAFGEDSFGDGEIRDEQLRLSSRDVFILTTPTTSGGPTAAQLWGLSEPTPPATIADTLADLPVLLSRGELTYDDLVELLNTVYVSGGTVATINFVGAGCALDTATLSGSWDDAMAARLSRLERLRRRTGMAIADLDQVVSSFSTPDPIIHANALDHLSLVRHLADTLRVKVPEVLAWFGLLSLRKEKDGNSQFERVFVDRARGDDPTTGTASFRLNASRTALQEDDTHVLYSRAWTASESSPKMPELTRALGIRAEQVTAIAKRILGPSAGPLKATVNTLSWLYRYVSIARAFKLNVDVLLRWLDVREIDLGQLSPIARAEEALRLDRQQAKATPNDVAYVLVGDPSPLDPKEADIVRTLTALRTGLLTIAATHGVKAIAADHDVLGDPLDPDGARTARYLHARFPAAPDATPPTDVGSDLLEIIARDRAEWTAGTRTAAKGLIDTQFPSFMPNGADVVEAKSKLVPEDPAPAPDPYLTDLADRYAYVLPFLTRAQRIADSTTAVFDTLARATSVTPPVASQILAMLHQEGSTSVKALDTFLALPQIDLTVTSDPTVRTTLTTYRRLSKLAFLARKLEYDQDELAVLAAFFDFDAIPARLDPYTTIAAAFTQPAVSSTVTVQVDATAWMVVGRRVWIVDAGYYSVSSIPDGTHVVLQNLGGFRNAAPGTSIATGLPVSLAPLSYEFWSTFRDLKHFRDLSSGQILDLLQKAISPSPPTVAELLAEFSDRTGWALADLTFLAGPTAFNVTTPVGFTEFIGKAARAMEVIRPLGIPVSSAWDWRAWPTGESAPYTARKAQAAAIKAAVRARVPREQLVDALKAPRDVIRERQRDALVAYLRATATPPLLKDRDALGEELLIDLSTAACSKTSRIKQALSSIQQFIQRISLGLEAISPDPTPISFSAKDLGPWEWMKNYRVWEANRKIFMWPENWIEPELRDDKTEFFRELENELLQDEITDVNVERA